MAVDVNSSCSGLYMITPSTQLKHNSLQCVDTRNVTSSFKKYCECKNCNRKKSSKKCRIIQSTTLKNKEEKCDEGFQKVERNYQGKTYRSELAHRPCRIERKWLVLLGSFYGICFSTGFIFHMSVLFVEFLDEFQKTKAETSLIQSVCIGVLFCSGLISGSVISKIGEGKSLVLGTVLSATGLAISSFAESIPFLVGSIGTIGGFGFSFIYIASFSIIPAYFDERQKFLAMGIIGVGAGIGGLFFPVFLQRLLETYHWKEVMLFISGIILNIMVFAMIDNPNERFKFLKTDEKVSVNKMEKHSKAESVDKSTNTNTSFLKKIRIILLNKAFICFAIAMMLALPVFNSTLIFLIDFFVSNDIQRSTGAWLHSGLNIASLISRPLPGVLARSPRIPTLAPSICFVFIGMIVMFVFPFVKSLAYLIVLSGVFGICFGGIISVISVTTLALIGQENYASAFGILMSGVGVTHVIAGPISGFFRDLTGTYDLSFFASSGTLFCSFLFLLIPMLCIKRILRSEEESDKINDVEKMCCSKT